MSILNFTEPSGKDKWDSISKTDTRTNQSVNKTNKCIEIALLEKLWIYGGYTWVNREFILLVFDVGSFPSYSY